jgi:hypothetical protein
MISVIQLNTVKSLNQSGQIECNSNYIQKFTGKFLTVTLEFQGITDFDFLLIRCISKYLYPVIYSLQNQEGLLILLFPKMHPILTALLEEYDRLYIF